jgi:cell division protein FtsW
MTRLFAFINPWGDPRGKGFHIIQSLIAVGSGGLFGLGLGGSKQKFFYLPQNYTDFIFAIFCEEMGLIGALGVILIYFLFLGRGMRIVRNAPDNFTFLLAGGIVSWIGLQAILNMSVVLGLLPTTGIPLPLISYGGTSLVAALFSIGLLLNVSQYRKA